MEIYTTSQSRQKLFQLVDYVAESHEFVYVLGKRNKAVLIYEEDFRAIQETLFLTAISGIKESILAADLEPLDQCKEKLDW